MLGEANISTASAGDIDQANNIAREMVYRCGFSKRLGPVALMDTEEVFIGRSRTRAVANIGTELATVAMADIEEVGRPAARLCPAQTLGVAAEPLSLACMQADCQTNRSCCLLSERLWSLICAYDVPLCLDSKILPWTSVKSHLLHLAWRGHCCMREQRR